ncbi:MAG TPA: hypothetical protein VHU40_10975 [Polyangia bacterium]|nr:hypothetical protein [Polyangia bacterium]
MLWACNSHRLAVPDPDPSVIDTRMFVQNVNHKLDLLFMVDDSQSMSPLQKKMSKQLGNFMDILVDKTTGQLPDLHVAVVSSSFGAGAWRGISGCDPIKGWPDYDGGKFLQGPGGAGNGNCSMLHKGAKFLDTGDGVNTHPNYDNDIRDAFQCMALLGESGCGFESQFKSVVYALEKAQNPDDPDNGGFLRKDAVLAIVLVTNEDDCSVSEDSLLLTPSVTSVMDATGVGALFNYRCNEFGHLCGGQAPPHGYPDPIPAGGVTLNDCVSAEEDGKTDDGVEDPEKHKPDPTHGHLWPTVKYFTDYVKNLKHDHPDDILVAAITGPAGPYKVISVKNPFHEGEMMPSIEHSCTFPTDDPTQPEFADPAIRINQWVRSFDTNGITYPICADDLKTAMQDIARKIHQKIGSSCVAPNPGWRENDNHVKVHNCTVQRVVDSSGAKPTPLPECLPIATNATNPERPTNAPCFQLLPDHADCTQNPAATATTLFRICENADCGPVTASSEQKHASVACAQDSP